jgi:hypothetical protein
MLACATLGVMIAGYLTLVQLDILSPVWDPLFGSASSRAVLDLTHPLPDAATGVLVCAEHLNSVSSVAIRERPRRGEGAASTAHYRRRGREAPPYSGERPTTPSCAPDDAVARCPPYDSEQPTRMAGAPPPHD